jgi:hypothetical protein
VVFVVEAVNQRHVDLHDLGTQHQHSVQVGVALAPVVDRDDRAPVAKVLDLVDDPRVRLDVAAFGDLQDHPGQVPAERGADGFGGEPVKTHVDRDRHVEGA